MVRGGWNKSKAHSFAEGLHLELGHAVTPNEDGSPRLDVDDPIYNSVQCLCYWACRGEIDGHQHWAPTTPKQAAAKVVKEINKVVRSKALAVYFLNELCAKAARISEKSPAPVYEVKTESTETGHTVEKVVAVPKSKNVAPAMVKETERKGSKAKPAAKAKGSSKRKTVVATL
jgi:hypothetical protein